MLRTVMKPLLEEKTEGRYTLEVYADGDLGGEEDFLKGIQNGTIEVGIAGVELSEQYPALKVIDFPFVFSDIDSSFLALSDTEIMEEVNRQISSSGILCKGFVLTGVRAISNSVRPIYSPEDCKGLTIREPDVNQFIEYAEKLGFETMTASVPEIFTVLQQKLADGQENPPIALLTSDWYLVQDYLSLTNHQITYNWLAVNSGFYEQMSEEDQRAFDECCQIYARTVKETYQEREDQVLEELAHRGVNITEVDREPFRQTAQELLDEYCKRYPSFQDMLLMLQSKGAR
ncbi:MAG: TRAP transporter substrate-binding protein [Clostridiales bacterium]|nr:TRAP transporter substrate-binding protein [Clostridiales bacterium]